jgi:2-keto-3-deoxy-6-phosphogluconate aldolase
LPPDGRPDFQCKFYALRKDGAFGAGAVLSGAQYSVCDEQGARVIDSPFLFEKK